MSPQGRGWSRLARAVLSSVVRSASAPRPSTARPTRRPTSRGSTGGTSAATPGGPAHPGVGYPGDFTGSAHLAYDPHPDGDADPGEIVWGWVPFEEDHARGKDRPALVVARDGRWVLALMLTSRDHDDAPRRAQAGGPRWMDLGTGDWDRERRPSEVRLDRVLRLDPEGIRREGAVLDRARFDAVSDRLRELHGWT